MLREKLAAFVIVLFLVSCGSSGIDPLKKAVLDGSTSIETTFNAIAGPDGSVSWYKPQGSPDNKNFKLIGAKVDNQRGAADYVLLVDTSSMTASFQSVVFNGKTIHFNSLGIPDDMETFAEIAEWELMSSLGL
jgi:hypothetical protein